MLEQPTLLLCPWFAADSGAGSDSAIDGDTGRKRAEWTRRIIEPALERRLGFARWDDSGLAGWLGRRLIQLFETDDASLVMTLERPWGMFRMWHVRDAEERQVGYAFRDVLFDGGGARLASLAPAGDGETALQTRGGQTLATWQHAPGGGILFRFAAHLDDNPFLRMVSLAAVLAQPPYPGDVVLAAGAAM